MEILFVLLFIPLFVSLCGFAVMIVFMVAEEIREIRKGMKKDADSYTIRWR